MEKGMKRYLDIRNSEEYKKLEEAAEIIKQGGIVLFPTETVYGIGGNGLNEKAVAKIYQAKGRKPENPINLLVCNQEMVESITKEITPLEYKLMKEFFPGPFTIILKKKEIVPNIVTANRDTVGIRMPSGEIAKKLVEYAGVPIAAPSANLSGKPSGTNLEDILGEFEGKVDYIINGGESEIGIESTIVRVIDEVPHILRPGAVTEEQIKKVAGNVILEYQKEKEENLLPSQNLSHYKTNTNCIVIYNKENDKQVEKVKQIASKYQKPIIICCDENSSLYSEQYKIMNMGKKDDLLEISRNIFTLLRKADKQEADVIIIEGIEKKGIGVAIMDRLVKASGIKRDNLF